MIHNTSEYQPYVTVMDLGTVYHLLSSDFLPFLFKKNSYFFRRGENPKYLFYDQKLTTTFAKKSTDRWKNLFF